MGNLSIQKDLSKQQYPFNSYHSEKDLKVIQWRANPTINECIPKTFLMYQNQIQQSNFLNQCKINKNLPIGVKFESFIGNLALLKGKLNFQESLYVLKSLLTGYKVILSFFGKVAVDLNFCFVTKEGEVKAWINSDFRKNTFETVSQQNHKPVTEEQKLFLSPQEWIDKAKQTSSTANIIRTIFIIVSDLTHDQKEYNNFLQKVKNFGMENILVNYDFERILKFINKFIYHKKLFVKSNLLEAIQRIYDDHFNKTNQRIEKCSESRAHQRLSHSEVPTYKYVEQGRQKVDRQSFETEDVVKLRKCMTGRQISGRSFTYNCPTHIKKQSDFESTFQSNMNTKPTSTITKSNIENFKDFTSSSKCSSRQAMSPQFSRKSSQRKNHISPQFSYNCVMNGNNSSVMSKNIVSLINAPTKMIPTSKNSITNKEDNAISHESSLKIISQRKQMENDELHHLKQNTSQKDAIAIHVQNPTSQMKKSAQVGFSYFGEQKSDSMISIGQNIESSISFTRKNKLKPYNSNCLQQRQPSNKNLQFTSPHKISNFRKNSINVPSVTDFKTVTMKTITKLISSSEDFSERQISQGEFPSNENIPCYTGILASMGRSAKIIQIPEAQKLSFKNDKKVQTMFISPNKSSFMSTNMFVTH